MLRASLVALRPVDGRLSRGSCRRPVRRAAATSQAQAAAQNPDKLYIEADQLVYDKDHNIVTATGNVVLYYKGRVLQADRVVYDRGTKRVMAEGRAKLTDEHGNIIYSPKFDLTDDFAAGFANSVQDPRRRTRPACRRRA